MTTILSCLTVSMGNNLINQIRIISLHLSTVKTLLTFATQPDPCIIHKIARFFFIIHEKPQNLYEYK